MVDLPDRLAIENEAERVDLDRLEARRRLVRLWQELRAAVGDPALAPVRLADGLETDIPRLDAATTLAGILDDSPELGFADLGVERARLALERERAEPVPDVEVSAAVLDNREPLAPGGPSIGTEWRGDVGVRIPLFDRNQGNIAAAEAELERSDAERRRARLKLEARFAPVFADYEQEYDRVSRYRGGILERARQAYELYRARHQQMAAAYPQVLLAQRAYFEAETSYVSALERLWESVVLLRGMLLSEEPQPSMLDDAVLRRTPIELAQ
jgi:cobalt-zinc-cadmium efflux system outer membrane protein